MTEIRSQPMWHVYGLEIPEGEELAGCWMTVVIEMPRPQEMPAVWPRSAKEDLANIAGDGPENTLLAGAPYLTSFDHHPSDAEMDELRAAVLGPERAAEYD